MRDLDGDAGRYAEGLEAPPPAAVLSSLLAGAPRGADMAPPHVKRPVVSIVQIQV